MRHHFKKKHNQFLSLYLKNGGASMVEAMIAVPIVLIACLLTLQIMFLYKTKFALNYATQEAARVGAMNNGYIIPRPVVNSLLDRYTRYTGPPLESGNIREIVKMFMEHGDSSVLQGFANGIMPLYVKGTNPKDIVVAQWEAYTNAMMNSCIFYHSPTQAAFADFGFIEVEGPDMLIAQIPNDMMRYRVPPIIDPVGRGINYYKSNDKKKYISDDEVLLRGSSSKMSVQEATLLSIEIRYSDKMIVPIAREILIGLARLWAAKNDQSITNTFDKYSWSNGRWPMSSYATYRMQTPVHWNPFFPSGDPNMSTFFGRPVPKAGLKSSYDPDLGFCPGLVLSTKEDKKNIPLGIKDNNWFGKDFDIKNYQGN